MASHLTPLFSVGGYAPSFETEAQAASRSALGKAQEGVPPHKPMIQRLQPTGGRQVS